jgi:hypothetical protein
MVYGPVCNVMVCGPAIAFARRIAPRSEQSPAAAVHACNPAESSSVSTSRASAWATLAVQTQTNAIAASAATRCHRRSRPAPFPSPNPTISGDTNRTDGTSAPKSRGSPSIETLQEHAGTSLHDTDGPSIRRDEISSISVDSLESGVLASAVRGQDGRFRWRSG